MVVSGGVLYGLQVLLFDIGRTRTKALTLRGKYRLALGSARP
jgi:hypothetical protein